MWLALPTTAFYSFILCSDMVIKSLGKMGDSFLCQYSARWTRTSYLHGLGSTLRACWI